MKLAMVVGGLVWALAVSGPASAQDPSFAFGDTAGPWGEAVNRSVRTTCAEDDNINVPLRALGIRRFQVQATHPTYVIGTDNCAADFSGCGQSAHYGAPLRDTCFDNPANKLSDDGINAVWVCPESRWWRPYRMKVVVGARQREGHRLVWFRKIAGHASWPQVLVLYQDGNLRLKPHPPTGRTDTCFGSSVVLGPAPLAARPYVDVRAVTVNPAARTLAIAYRIGGTADLTLSVTRARAVVDVRVSYSTVRPFATFRSMWVKNWNSDVDRIRADAANFPILGNWTGLGSPWWFFYRRTRSLHNTSAPDFWIRTVE